MSKRDVANENRLIGLIYKEIMRFTHRKGIETLTIQGLSNIIDTSLVCACDVHLNKLDLEEVVKVIKKEFDD
jgi:hypothetical protein